ncbi:RING finger protein nhl-1-like [Orbicella faveolata]|uniref:RING finger protein nhl-1-like n=1 Tax=Orbicella faveolata TaxID=48498 RepID=UPI0009E4870A|nr:RING finger protein nhl-1-like [Orbicella faveolata]
MEGNIVVTDNVGHFVYVFDEEGKCLRKIGGLGRNSGQFRHPQGLFFFSNDEVLIADNGNHRIQHLNIETGTVVKTFGKHGTGKGEFQYPRDVCMDDEGRIVVAEYENNRIQVISKEG